MYTCICIYICVCLCVCSIRTYVRTPAVGTTCGAGAGGVGLLGGFSSVTSGLFGALGAGRGAGERPTLYRRGGDDES